MDRRQFIISSSAGLLAGAAASSAQAAVDPNITATLKIFRPASDSDIRLTNAAMARFKTKFPNVTATPQYVSSNPWGEYINQMMNSLGGSTTLDVVMMATEGVSTLGSRKVLRDIMPFVKADAAAQAIVDGTEANIVNALRYGGTLSYLPAEWNTVVTFYNTAMFQEAGIAAPDANWDWAKFLEIAKALSVKDSSGNITRYSYFIPGGQFGLAPWFLSNDTDRLTPDGRHSNARDPKFRETLEYLHALIFEHKVAPTFVRNDYGHGPFIAKQAAMFSGTHGRIPEMITAGLKTVGVQSMPRNKERVAIIGAGGFGITQASKNPDLAFQFIKELCGKENSDQLARDMRAIPPARSSATTAEYLAFPVNSKVFYGSAAIGRAQIQPPNFSEVEAITMRHIEAYLTGNRKIEETIDAFDAELSRAMSRVRW